MRLTVFFFVKFKSFKYEKLYFKYSGNAIIFYINARFIPFNAMHIVCRRVGNPTSRGINYRHTTG